MFRLYFLFPLLAYLAFLSGLELGFVYCVCNVSVVFFVSSPRLSCVSLRAGAVICLLLVQCSGLGVFLSPLA